MDYKLVCAKCQFVFSQEEAIYCCNKCDGPLEVQYSLNASNDKLNKVMLDGKGSTIWRYKELIPLIGSNIISIGEGSTPLVSAQNLAQYFNINELMIKNESANPSGTFKDRCSSVSISKAKELGAEAVILGSAGNAGASAAAYAACAGIPCYVLVPEKTPLERVAQTLMYGSRLILVDGTVNDCIDLVKEIQQEYGWHNVTTASVYNPYQAEGVKTIAYEIAEAMNWEVPDWIIAPVGGGGIVNGIWKGYNNLLKLGLISKLPKIAAAQASGCAPLVNAYLNNYSPLHIQKWNCAPDTIAAAIADPFPEDGMFALRAIYDSKGYAVAVTDEDILKAQKLTSEKQGIFAEPASSTTIAALSIMKDKEIIKQYDKVVAIITGTGLKDPGLAIKNVTKPPISANNIEELKGLISTWQFKHQEPLQS